MQKVTVRKGLVYLGREVGDLECNGADKIRQATLRGSQHACTKLPLPSVTRVTPDVDDATLEAVLMKIECIAADAAADVQLAGRELAGNALLAGRNKRTL